MKLPFVNYVKEAFSLPFNLTFLGLTAAATLGYGFLVPGHVDWLVQVLAFGGASAELLYLSFAPNHPRFIRAINSKYQRDVDQLNRQIGSFRHLSSLDPNHLRRYMSFHQKKQQIIENLVSRNKSNEFFSVKQMDKINRLEAYYVDLLYSEDQFNNLLESDKMGQMLNERNRIVAEMEASTGKISTLYSKRLEVLDKRIARFEKGQENLKMATIQIATLEDTIKFLLEQSMVVNNPMEIMNEVDAVIEEAEFHTATIEELDSILHDMEPPMPIRKQTIDEDLPDYNPTGLRN